MELSKNYISVYYIGLNDKETHKQKLKTETFIKLLNAILKDYKLDSYTLNIVTGYYKGEPETTLKVELLNDSLSGLAIETIKELFNQECIMDITLPLYKSELGLFR